MYGGTNQHSHLYGAIRGPSVRPDAPSVAEVRDSQLRAHKYELKHHDRYPAEDYPVRKLRASLYLRIHGKTIKGDARANIDPLIKPSLKTKGNYSRPSCE